MPSLISVLLPASAIHTSDSVRITDNVTVLATSVASIEAKPAKHWIDRESWAICARDRLTGTSATCHETPGRSIPADISEIR